MKIASSLSRKSGLGSKAIVTLFHVALACVLVSTVAAQDGGEDPVGGDSKKAEVKENVQTGVIANVGAFPEGAAIDVQTGDAAPGGESNVIQGSVSEAARGTCEARVTNTSAENAYSVRFRVIGKNEQGANIVNRSFSASLKPKESITRSVACQPEHRMQLVLLSATKR